jgi:glutathione S-transferase
MKLYYAPGACSLATHIVLEWIGKHYDLEQVDIHGKKSPELLEVNPAGAVPVIEDDGWVLTQNSAILNYLADVYPEARLGGDGSPRSRGEVNRWLGLVNSDVHPAYKPLFGATGYLEDEAAIEKAKGNAKAAIRSKFEIIDKQLEGRDWLVGERSIADPYLFVMLRWAKAMDVDFSDLEGLSGLFQRMHDDAAVKKVLEAEGLT